VRRAPSEHAGGKFRLRYPSVLGGSQNLEVDVSYVARVPVWGRVRSRTLFPPGSDLQVPTLAIEELAAGKFAALVQRSATRDAFDAANLLTLMPDLVERPMFRVAFVCLVAGSRSDPRRLEPVDVVPSERTIEKDLDPLLRRDRTGTHPTSNALRTWIAETVGPAVEPLLSWSLGERRFLERLLEDGEVVAEALHDDSDVQDRIRRQPMLNWKAQHVREHRRTR
jgi:hypothetical protein